jgi:hypothetical protein
MMGYVGIGGGGSGSALYFKAAILKPNQTEF